MRKITFNVYDDCLQDYLDVKALHNSMTTTELMNFIIADYFPREFWSRVGIALVKDKITLAIAPLRYPYDNYTHGVYKIIRLKPKTYVHVCNITQPEALTMKNASLITWVENPVQDECEEWSEDIPEGGNA